MPNKLSEQDTIWIRLHQMHHQLEIDYYKLTPKRIRELKDLYNIDSGTDYADYVFGVGNILNYYNGNAQNVIQEQKKQVKIGSVCVDSGTLMIVDPCYITGDKWTDKEYDKEVVGMNTQFAQVLNKTGIVFESGLGDGLYEVFATIEDIPECGKRITEVRLKLL